MASAVCVCVTFVPLGAGKTHTMMGSERVVGARADNGSMEVSGIVPQSLVELFRLLDERMEMGSGEDNGVETWTVRVGYLQVRYDCMYVCACVGGKCEHFTPRTSTNTNTICRNQRLG